MPLMLMQLLSGRMQQQNQETAMLLQPVLLLLLLLVLATLSTLPALAGQMTRQQTVLTAY
jgi:hypothetical protein